VLVLRPGALGDTLLAVPALRALRRAFGPVTLAAHGGAARLLASLGEVDSGLSFDDPSLGWLFRDQLPEEAVLGWLSAEHLPALKHALLVAPSQPAGGGQHVARYLLATLTALGVDGVFDERSLRVNRVESDEVLVHPGSGSATKNWPAARFAATIEALGCPVRLIVGEADERAASNVEACLGHALPHLEHASLAQLAARLAGCRAYIGNDSGVTHLAGLAGARTVALFGPTPPELWHPLGPQVHVEPFTATPDHIAQLLLA
jgi:ADP-heptose:LPS heptosyltransferase